MKLAVIPARGGSKRIPRKNIKEFCGKPIIAYSIEAALKSGLFDTVMVSTDDREIADVAIKFGADVPFLRSDVMSNDTATIAEMLEEVIYRFKESGVSYTEVCLIYATAPFVHEKNLIDAYSLMNRGEYDAVIPVIRYSYPIQRALQIENDTLSMINPNYMKTRSQDLSPSYHDSGQFFWIKPDVLLQEKKVFVSNTGAIIIDEKYAQDIDTEEDWQIAEFKYKYFCM